MTMPSHPTPLFDTLDHLRELSPSFDQHTLYCQQDFDLALDFLKQYDGNTATFNSYRREIERALHFAWIIQKKSILAFHRADVEAYIRFCQSPPSAWISLKKSPRFLNQHGKRVPNSEWRPFVATVTKAEAKKGKIAAVANYELSQKSTKEIFVVLSSFYKFMTVENVMEFNPILTIRQKSKFIMKSQNNRKIPRLSDLQWEAVVNTAESLASQNPAVHERTLFIISALYLMYLRISELASSARWMPLMKHFHQDSHGNWWFVTVGKGNKERHVTVSDSMLAALRRWRRHLDLSPDLPTPQDNMPLLPKISRKGSVGSTRWINSIVQLCFDISAETLRKNGFEQDAENLENATAHWLRHTGISDDINKRARPMAHVRDDAGHASVVTTDRYNDVTLQERHASARMKKIVE